MKRVRNATAQMVTTLDFRHFAIGTSEFYSDTTERNISESFRFLEKLFPNLRCLILDGHPEFDPSLLSRHVAPEKEADSTRPLAFMSMAQCRTQLPTKYFDKEWLMGLVYLDISDMPGSIRSQLEQGSLSTQNLPSLRILKAQGREIDDWTAILLLQIFRTRLWSLDLTRNNLTDAIVNHLIRESFPTASLHTDTHFYSEGKITFPIQAGSDLYGPFKFIEDSLWSRNFSHHEKYLADTPVYSDTADLPIQEGTLVRSDGRSKPRQDTADVIKAALAGDLDHPTPDLSEIHHLDASQGHGGITHLYLSENGLSSEGIHHLLRHSPGQLEQFECGDISFGLKEAALPNWLRKSAKLSGIVGASHLFRPVASSNLRVLSIHHSLVTQTPTLDADNISAMSKLWLAETILRGRIDLAYPLSFVPDMNPRLYSLTLTRIPRYSTGWVTKKLINLLRLAAVQERAIADSTSSNIRRAPTMVKGLRHIRLEFDPDPTDEISGLEEEDLDAGDFVTMADEEFSFFGDTGWRALSTSNSPTSDELPADAKRQDPNADENLGELDCPPFSETQGDYIEHTGSWNDQDFTIPVWIGSGVFNNRPAVNEYMTNLCDPELQSNIIPASPNHVAAGVPPGSYIYRNAWDAMLAPPKWGRPLRSDLTKMKDVVAELKKYRLDTRAAYKRAKDAAGGGAVPLGKPHFFWTGKLEVALNDHAVHSSKYWR